MLKYKRNIDRQISKKNCQNSLFCISHYFYRLSISEKIYKYWIPGGGGKKKKEGEI